MICKYIYNRRFWNRYRLYKGYYNNKEFTGVCRDIAKQIKQ